MSSPWPSAPAAPTLPGLARPEWTVSELAFALKRTVEAAYPYVRVRGEISGYKGPHSSGHCYFALKDANARIDACVWRSAWMRLKFKPADGLEVIATGKLTTYPGRSNYQLVIEALEPAGIGALMALLEERRKKLAAEGLFDAAGKKPIPYLPRRIGVVTSPTGAVIRDILHRLQDRFPRPVLLWPVRVQGETCAGEVAAAIRGFNALPEAGPIPRPDLLIVARGGGSLEDLWGFNEESVVRAAAASRIPLISAIGHETDWTLLDHAADARAPTPTAAAEQAVPVRAEVLAALAALGVRRRRAHGRLVEECRAGLRSAARALPRLEDLLALPRQRFDGAQGRLVQALRANTLFHHTRHVRAASRLSPQSLQRRCRELGERLRGLAHAAGRALPRQIALRRDRLAAEARLLVTLSYQAVLGRGFALVRDAAGRPVRSALAAEPGDPVSIEFHDGRRAARIEGAAAGPEDPAGQPAARSLSTAS